MRKLATTALTALSISLLGSAAALADHAPQQGPQGPGYQGPGYNQQYNGPQNPQPGQGQWNQGPRSGGPGNGQWNQNPQGGQYGDRRLDDDRFNDDRFGGERGYDDGRFGGGRGYDDHRFDGDRRFNRNFDFRLHFGNFDRWERGWGYGNYHNQYQSHQPLNHWRLVRVLERQGFYGVRGLRQAHRGWGLRAFAFNQRGRPVMLRVNPYTGRVMDVRYI
ncbi:MAG: hypothetical protein HOP13_15800 [Alphaproteobacteria bacterium]|nr:hypothetical protein [Alphaproteobacteria bacterium]